jgi:MarR family transcriptional regulator, organic hydroperoxide resistance regulator
VAKASRSKTVEASATESEEQSLGEVLDFLQRIWALAHALQRASKHMSQTRGLTGPQRLVIRVTGRFPGVSAGALARILHLHPSTLTGVLRRLERRGLIERMADSGDRRRALFRLSRAGKAHDMAHAGTVEHAVEQVLAKTGARERRAADQVLAALIAALAAQTSGKETSGETGPSSRRRPQRR